MQNRIMSYLLFIFFTGISTIIFSKDDGSGFKVMSDKSSYQVGYDEAKFYITPVFNDGVQIDRTLLYSIDDGPNVQLKVNAKTNFTILCTPGKHKFKLYFNGYAEIFTQEIKATGGHLIQCKAFFQKQQEITVEKPVIYMYPTEEIQCTVQVKPKGEISFTYPKMDSVWKVNCAPNGEITHNDNLYNYLFWEAKEDIHSITMVEENSIIINGKNSSDFLERKLNDFGFSSKEKADFITFWGPKLNTETNWEISFILNQDAQIFGDLLITPKPDQLYRFYILARETEKQVSENQDIKFDPIKREGFTVLEWGGTILPKETNVN